MPNPSDLDELVCGILSDAQLHSPCATAKCRLSADVHRSWFWITHLEDGHVCPFHTGESYPTWFLSFETLIGSRRDVLASSLNAWLTHLHCARTPAPSGGRDGAPAIDADPAGAFASGSSALSLGDPVGDRVGSSPRD